MNCPKCGCELVNGVCPICSPGTNRMVMYGMEVKCRNCNAVNIAGPDQKEMFCAYCGSSIKINQAARMMRPQNQSVAASSAKLNPPVAENDRRTLDRNPEEEHRAWQSALERNPEDESRRWKSDRDRRRKVRLGALAVILSAAMILTTSFSVFRFLTRSVFGMHPAQVVTIEREIDYPELIWPNDQTLELIPKWEGEYGEIYSWDDEVGFTFFDVSREEFAAYQNSCRELGYTIHENYDRDSFNAFSADQYGLNLYYYEEDRTMYGNLTKPVDRTAIAVGWPVSNLGDQLPKLTDKTVYVTYNDEDSIMLTVADVTREEMNAYVRMCIEKGFEQEYSMSGEMFFGESDSGSNLTVEYDNAFGQMNITLYDY